MTNLSDEQNMEPMTGQATPQDLRRQRIKCWWATCRKRAWFEDFSGARYCPFHIYYVTRWGGGNIWAQVRHIKFYFGGF